MLTLKVVSQYPCAYGGDVKEATIKQTTKTRILTVESVDVDAMAKEWIVTCGRDDVFVVPYFHDETSWKSEDGFTSDVYVENERGKTVHSLRSVNEGPEIKFEPV